MDFLVILCRWEKHSSFYIEVEIVFGDEDDYDGGDDDDDNDDGKIDRFIDRWIDRYRYD